MPARPPKQPTRSGIIMTSRANNVKIAGIFYAILCPSTREKNTVYFTHEEAQDLRDWLLSIYPLEEGPYEQANLLENSGAAGTNATGPDS